MIRYLLHSVLVAVLLLFAGYACAKSAKTKISRVDFIGNETFSETELLKVVVSRPSRYLRPSYYHPSVFLQDLDFLTNFYNNKGFLDFEVVDYVVDLDSLKREAYLTIDVYEGDRTFIDSLSITGIEAFVPDSVYQFLRVKPTDPLLYDEIEQSTADMLTFYSDRGFLDAKTNILVVQQEDPYQVNVTIELSEGRKFSVDQIRVRGVDFTRKRIVRRQLKFDLGDVINYSNIVRSQRSLYMTGLYQSVNIRPVHPASDDSSKKDMIVTVRERKPIEMKLAAGYSSLERFRGKAEISNINIIGSAQQVGGLGRISFTGYGAELFYVQPWLFNIPWRFDWRLFNEYAIEPGYEVHRMGTLVSVSHSFYENSLFTITYKYEKSQINDISVDIIPDDKYTNIRSLKQSFKYDDRNNFFNTTEGMYYDFSNELAGLFLEGSNTFFRTILKFRYYYPWTVYTTLATAIELGFMDSPDGLNQIPLNERFYAGGPNSLRGFSYQMVGPLDEDSEAGERQPLGGRFKLILNLVEVRRSVYKFIGCAAFVDMGNVWTNYNRYKPFDMRISPGFGLRLNTPIGLLRLDYGFNIFRRESEPPNKLYFNLGQSF